MFNNPMFIRSSFPKMTSLYWFRNVSKKTVASVIRNETKIKDKNLESKLLFGSVIKKKKLVDVAAEPKGEEKDMSSEIYWLTQHTSVPDFTQTKKTQRASKKIKSKKDYAKKSKSKTEPKINILENIYNVSSQIKSNQVPQIHYNPIVVESLEKFKNSLLPFTSDENKLAAPITNHAQSPSIPFTSRDLKLLLDFPLRYEDKKLNNLEYTQPVIQFKPSVTTILQSTMSESSRKALMQWKTIKIAELGIEGFNQLQKSHLDKGRNFHSCLQEYFQAGDLLQEKIAKVTDLWKSISPALEKIDTPAEIVEVKISHPHLHYKGIVDCVSSIENNMFIIEWKKSDRVKRTLDLVYDAPLQLCAYLGALNYDERYRHLNINNGIVVVGYSTGEKADVHHMNQSDLKLYWRAWLHRLQEYWTRYRDQTLPEPI